MASREEKTLRLRSGCGGRKLLVIFRGAAPEAGKCTVLTNACSCGERCGWKQHRGHCSREARGEARHTHRCCRAERSAGAPSFPLTASTRLCTHCALCRLAADGAGSPAEHLQSGQEMHLLRCPGNAGGLHPSPHPFTNPFPNPPPIQQPTHFPLGAPLKLSIPAFLQMSPLLCLQGARKCTGTGDAHSTALAR